MVLQFKALAGTMVYDFDTTALIVLSVSILYVAEC